MGGYRRRSMRAALSTPETNLHRRRQVPGPALTKVGARPRRRRISGVSKANTIPNGIASILKRSLGVSAPSPVSIFFSNGRPNADFRAHALH